MGKKFESGALNPLTLQRKGDLMESLVAEEFEICCYYLSECSSPLVKCHQWFICRLYIQDVISYHELYTRKQN